MSIEYSDLASIFDPAIETGRCGPNLEYDPRFLWIESEASGRRKAFFATPDHRIDEPQADWHEVSAVAKVLLAQSKDLRTAVYLLRALVVTEGLIGLARGLYVINRLVAEYWDCLHPELENDDPTWRLNVLAGLSDSDGLLRELRNAEVVYTRQEGRIRVGDLLTLERTRAQASYVRETDDLAQRAGAILASRYGDQPFKAALNDAVQWLDELRKRLVKELTSQVEELRQMIAIVRESLRWLGSALLGRDAASADEWSWSPQRSAPAEVSVPRMGLIPNDEMPRKLRGTHFTVYRPLAVRPEVWVSFLVYLHSGTGAAVDEDSARRLGRSRAQYDADEDAARVAIAQGAEITVVPSIPGCQFNPRRQTLEWFEDVHVVEFRLRASPDVAGYTTQGRLRGHVRVYVGPLLVAEIPTSVWASDEVMSEQPVPT